MKVKLSKEAIIEVLSTPKNIVITTHFKPDGDALGSSLGLRFALEKMGHQVSVIVPSDYPPFLHWLPGNKQVIVGPEHPRNSSKLIRDADVVFCLDFNQLSRINDLGEKIEESQAIKVLIDHHLEPSDFADFDFVNTAASSTCELVWDFLEIIQQIKLVDKEIATCLYTGIVTDTGSFRFSSTSPKLHRLVANLLELGVVPNVIHEAIYDESTFTRLQLLGYVLANCLVHLPEYRTAYIAISKDILAKFNIETGDSEGFVNYALSISGVKFACLIIDRGSIRKLSFRSKGTIASNKFASQFFGGGGHLNASGGASNTSFEDTIALFLKELPGFYKSW